MAENFTRRILDHIASLARLGHGGVARDGVATGIRLSVFGQYGIYFRQDDAQLTVLRILHSRRDTAAMPIEDDPTTH